MSFDFMWWCIIMPVMIFGVTPLTLFIMWKSEFMDSDNITPF